MGEGIEVKHAVVGMFQANCFAVKVGPRGQGFLIDPGDEPDVIVELVRETGLEGSSGATSEAGSSATWPTEPWWRRPRSRLSGTS